MNKVFIILFTLLISGCDIIPIQHETNICMEHMFFNGTYIVTKVEGLRVYLRKLEDGSKRKIGRMDREWTVIGCPKPYGSGPSKPEKEK